ncbi:MAG: response regulator [Elusimicrobia bacterium]|nr:response regulator [Candidatus Liberimonas magnetica]
MGKKILICDDKELTLKVLGRGLTIAGYEVIEAHNGEEGLEKAKIELPDLIMLDIIMPKMDGFSVNLKLKENDKTKDIPVIISTTRAMMSEMFESSGRAKINGFLEKPYTLEELWAKVKEVLGE